MKSKLGESVLTVHIFLMMEKIVHLHLVMTSKNELISIFFNEKFFNTKIGKTIYFGRKWSRKPNFGHHWTDGEGGLKMNNFSGRPS